MNETPHCDECGAELPSNAPEGLCPKCLLQPGLVASATGVRSQESVISGQLSVEKTVLDQESRTALSGALPREGQRFGDYRLVRLLGQGGTGAVYEAEHLPSERRVALKVLIHRLDSPEARQRFLREGQLAASINHPNCVYVFGTEEIDGIPVISMELAPGGTLKDRVKEKGPLPVAEAVDVILQVMAGLEAAQAKGVLHRDIKPANCFVDADGTVKVGDFGLSISSLGRGETHLTVSGSLLGTPAFASPEQIRGDELDIGSDIYSVGVTLYYLLTGRTPFESEHMARLLAMVLEKVPDSPRKLRPEIPQGLATVVLRCLDKRTSNRFKDHRALGRALKPFGSISVTPATQGWRMTAWGIDILVCYYIWNLGGLIWPVFVADNWDSMLHPVSFGGKTYELLNLHLVWLLLYFTLTEGIWGFSLGKLICGLRAVRLDRDVAGVPRAFLRAFILFSFAWLPAVLALVLNLTHVSDHSVFGRLIGQWLSSFLLDLVWFIFLFWGATERNGFQGLHDRLTRTRVIRIPDSKERPLFQAHDELLAMTEPAHRIGPYFVLGPIVAPLQGTTGLEFPERSSNDGRSGELHEDRASSAFGLFLGHDARLLRNVWIHTLPRGTPPLPLDLRTLNRPGRLVWLNGKRSDDECWDVYEALSGRPFLHGLKDCPAWKSVRWWLLDLAEALHAWPEDRLTPTTLDLSRIWITAEGRAKLLDFPAPGTTQTGRAEDVALEKNKAMTEACRRGTPSGYWLANLFLRQVAVSAMEGRSLTLAESMHSPISTPLPLHAHSLLETLKCTDGELLEGTIRSISEQPGFVSFPKRLGLLAGSGFLTCFSLGGGLVELMAGRDSLTDVLEKSSSASLFAIVPSAVLALVFRDGFLWRNLEVAVVTKDGSVASRLRLFCRTLVSWSPILLSFGILNSRLLEGPVSTWSVCALLVIFFVGAVSALLKPDRSLQDRLAGTWLVPR